MGGPGGHVPPQVLGYQLTLFRPRGQIMPAILLLCPPIFLDDAAFLSWVFEIRFHIEKWAGIKVNKDRTKIEHISRKDKLKPLKSVHFKKTVARILFLSKLRYFRYKSKNTTNLKETRFAQLSS